MATPSAWVYSSKTLTDPPVVVYPDPVPLQPRGFKGGHSEAYRAELLDSDDNFVDDLKMLVGGTISWNIFNEVTSGGSVTVRDDGIDWLKSRIGLFYFAELGSVTIKKQLMVGVITAATPGRYGLVTLTFQDKTGVLAEDSVEETYSAVSGQNVMAAVRALISSIGETKMALQVSGETVKNVMNLPAGTSKLTVVNALLKSIGFGQLWVDGAGYFQAQKETRPGDRATVFSFVPGPDCVADPEVEDSKDMLRIPNKVLVVATSDGDAEALSASATNTDLNSPYSVQNRGDGTILGGRVILKKYEGVEATSQAVLDAMAVTLLSQASQVTWRQTIKSFWVDLEPNESVIGHSGQKASVVEKVVTMTPGAKMSTVVRRMDTMYGTSTGGE